MTFVADGGATRVSVPVSGRVVDDRRLTVAGLSIWHEIEAVFERKICAARQRSHDCGRHGRGRRNVIPGCARILLSGVLVRDRDMARRAAGSLGAELIVQIVGAGAVERRQGAGRVADCRSRRTHASNPDGISARRRVRRRSVHRPGAHRRGFPNAMDQPFHAAGRDVGQYQQRRSPPHASQALTVPSGTRPCTQGASTHADQRPSPRAGRTTMWCGRCSPTRS